MDSTMNSKLQIAPYVLALVLVGGCAHHSKGAHEGSFVGGAFGAALGGLVTGSWKGAIVGGAIGAVVGNELGEVADRDAREAARQQRTIVHHDRERRERIVTRPVGYDRGTHCYHIHRRVWQDGELVVDEVVDVCETFDAH